MWTRWSDLQFSERHKLLDKCLHTDPVFRDIHRLYQLLDAKSAALFTHVSIMIAACTFLAGSPTDGQVTGKIIFLISTTIYVLIAIKLLRILDFNMYDWKIELPDPELIFTHRTDDMYDSNTDRAFRDLRRFFIAGVKQRGIAHKSALRWTRRMTISVVFFLLYDIAQKVLDNTPQSVWLWLRATVS